MAARRALAGVGRRALDADVRSADSLMSFVLMGTSIPLAY